MRQLNSKQAIAADLGSVVQVKTGATEPLQSGGALMLGGDQDCYGSCTDSFQAFNRLMDEVSSCTCLLDELELLYVYKHNV